MASYARYPGATRHPLCGLRWTLVRPKGRFAMIAEVKRNAPIEQARLAKLLAAGHGAARDLRQTGDDRHRFETGGDECPADGRVLAEVANERRRGGDPSCPGAACGCGRRGPGGGRAVRGPRAAAGRRARPRRRAGEQATGHRARRVGGQTRCRVSSAAGKSPTSKRPFRRRGHAPWAFVSAPAVPGSSLGCS